MISFLELRTCLHESSSNKGVGGIIIQKAHIHSLNLHSYVEPMLGWSVISLCAPPGMSLDLYWDACTIDRIQGNQLCLRSSEGTYYLFPNQAHRLTIDDHFRIRKQEEVLLHWKTNEKGIHLTIDANVHDGLHLNVIVCEHQRGVEEWFQQKKIEETLWAVEGSWTTLKTPHGLFDYWLLGTLYSKRFSDFGRFPSGQDAFSLFRIVAFLFLQTKQDVYLFFMRVLASSLYASQREDGSWPNGEWLLDPEVHTRFNIDGARLLHKAGILFDESHYIVAAKATYRYFAERGDDLEGDALWFLHDACEFEEEAFEKKQKQALKHHAFGKKSFNALVLNTHVQTLVGIAELQETHPDEELSGWEEKGMRALELVLEARPKELYYRLADFFLYHILSVEKASLPIRILRRFGFKKIFNLYKIQTHPRFVSPDGYIYRDATLPLYGYWYHFVNLYDLQQLHYYRPHPIIGKALEKGLSYRGNASLATFLVHYNHYVAPQWWQVQHLANADTSSYQKALMDKGYGVPPETQLEEGLFTPLFWKTLKSSIDEYE